MGWFLYDGDFRHERGKLASITTHEITFVTIKQISEN